MPTGPHPSTVPAWTIRAIAVRTRDGPERLDQAYRLLLNARHPGGPPTDPDSPPGPSAPSRPTSPRR
jgi:hypothetical protein